MNRFGSARKLHWSTVLALPYGVSVVIVTGFRVGSRAVVCSPHTSWGTSINIRIGRYTKLSDGWGRGDKRA